jgi:hypothetical protein
VWPSACDSKLGKYYMTSNLIPQIKILIDLIVAMWQQYAPWGSGVSFRSNSWRRRQWRVSHDCWNVFSSTIADYIFSNKFLAVALQIPPAVGLGRYLEAHNPAVMHTMYHDYIIAAVVIFHINIVHCTSRRVKHNHKNMDCMQSYCSYTINLHDIVPLYYLWFIALVVKLHVVSMQIFSPVSFRTLPHTLQHLLGLRP